MTNFGWLESEAFARVMENKQIQQAYKRACKNHSNTTVELNVRHIYLPYYRKLRSKLTPEKAQVMCVMDRMQIFL